MKTQLKLRVFQLLVIVFVSVGIGYILGNYKISARWESYKPIIGISNQNPPDSKNLDMRSFYDVIDKLNLMYFDKSKIDATQMVNGAISGMVASLGDPYTAFFPPKENTEFKEQLAGEFSGIGAELSQNDEQQIIVVAPLDGSPAERAGVRSGDIIARVEGKSTAGWTIAEAVENIRGKKGTEVTITLARPEERYVQDVTIVRDTIVVKSVTSWVKQFDCTRNNTCVVTTNCANCPTIAYVRISQFGDKTNDEWLEAVNELLPETENARNFKGIVLDVRNNPGGYMHDAVYIASEFIKSGPIVKQRDGNNNTEVLEVNRTGVLLDTPLVVLINKGSASASEIVSGALQDYNRAKLIGENSFGKGTVQQAVEVGNGASVHISIAKWLTPKERWVHDTGLTPDIEVPYDASASATMTDQTDNQIRRAVLELAR